jgi:hypothetical protein
MLDVFRFARFAVRTFFGVIALVLTLYAALWLFVQILSAAPANADPDAAPRRVMSYDPPAIRYKDRQPAAAPPGSPSKPHPATKGER